MACALVRLFTRIDAARRIIGLALFAVMSDRKKRPGILISDILFSPVKCRKAKLRKVHNDYDYDKKLDFRTVKLRLVHKRPKS